MEVLRSRPTDSVAAIGLAAIALDIAESRDATTLLSQMHDFASLSYDAVRSGVTAPIALRMCMEVAQLIKTAAEAVPDAG